MAISTTIHFDPETETQIERIDSVVGPFTAIRVGRNCDIIIRDEYRPKLQELADKIAAYLAQQVEAA